MKDILGKDIFSQFIGFEDTINTLRKATETASKAMGYPPYNIKQVKDNKYVIEMAVAGFAKSDYGKSSGSAIGCYFLALISERINYFHG